MKPQYRYVRIDRYGTKFRYFPLQQNPLSVAWLLYWYGEPLGFSRHGLRRALSDSKRLFEIIVTLLYYRLFAPCPDDVIVLPVSGDLSLKVQRGYKVFDLHRKVVVKVFRSEFDLAKIQQEIAWIQRVEAYGLAPTLRRWNDEERWYEEEYVNGYCLVRQYGTRFDLYDVIFKQLRRGHAIPNMTVEMEQTISYLQSCLALNKSASTNSLVTSLSAMDVYRWIYYLEKTCPVLKRKEKITERQVEKTFSFIVTYDLYERSLPDNITDRPRVQC